LRRKWCSEKRIFFPLRRKGCFGLVFWNKDCLAVLDASFFVAKSYVKSRRVTGLEVGKHAVDGACEFQNETAKGKPDSTAQASQVEI